MTGSADQKTAIETGSVEWKVVDEAGGIHNWVLAELRRMGLVEETDTSTLSAKEKKAYRARRDEERRVRRILQKIAWQSYRASHLVHLGPGVFYHDTADVDKFYIPEPETRLEHNFSSATVEDP